MLMQPVRSSLGCLSLVTLIACGSSGNGPGSNNTAGSGGNATGHAGSSGTGGSSAGSGGTPNTPTSAGIQMRVNSTTAQSGGGQNLLAFAGGGAVRPGLENLEYMILGVQICESMQATGSGFSNPGGCLELYRNDTSGLNYDLTGDWTPLADAARDMTTGFVDLLDPSSRATLNGRTEIGRAHV